MDNLIAFSKPFIEPLLSLYIYSPLIGVLIGVYITYKFTIDRDRMMVANEAYKTLYGAFFIKLSTIKINIEIKKKEYGKRTFRKLNKETLKYKNISLIAKLIIEVSDDIHKMVKRHDHDKLSMVVVSRYFTVEQLKEQICLNEMSVLDFGEDKKLRMSRIARLHYELVSAKISFVQALLEDMQKISKMGRVKDKEMKETIKFLLRTCRRVKKREISKMYGFNESKNIKIITEKNIHAG